MLNKTTLALAGAVLILGSSLATTLLMPNTSEARISQLVSSAVKTELAQQAPTQSATEATKNSGLTPEFASEIENYLMKNPRILERMSIALQTEMDAEASSKARSALASMHDRIYNDENNVVLGNPEGDVTLVEFFDYNCGYCRQVVADIMALVDEDPNLRVILKEYPILSQGSVDAARIAILVNKNPELDYAEFHAAMFANRGGANAQTAMESAASLGINPVMLELDMNTSEITSAIQANHSLGQALNITGTPTFIIGNEILPGALKKDQLKMHIDNMRKCGEAICI